MAIIGVGGGRDILSALAAGNTRVTGIEMNGILLSTLTSTYRDFANIATHPGVTTGARRGAVVPQPLAGQVRRAPDVADRHVGGDRRRRVHPVGERPLHRRGVACVPQRAAAGRRLQRLSLVQRRDASRRRRDCCRSAWRPSSIAAAIPAASSCCSRAAAVATLMTSNHPFSDADRDRLLARARDEEFSVLLSPVDATGRRSSGPRRREPHARRAGRSRRRSRSRLLASKRRSAVLLQHAQAAAAS